MGASKVWSLLMVPHHHSKEQLSEVALAVVLILIF